MFEKKSEQITVEKSATRYLPKASGFRFDTVIPKMLSSASVNTVVRQNFEEQAQKAGSVFAKQPSCCGPTRHYSNPGCWLWKK